jgi:hypothetical protein
MVRDLSIADIGKSFDTAISPVYLNTNDPVVYSGTGLVNGDRSCVSS